VESRSCADWEEKFLTIFNHIKNVSMGDNVFDDSFLNIVRRTLPVMKEAITKLPIEQINIRLASEIAMSCGMEPPLLCKRKINDPQRICIESSFIMVYMLAIDNRSFVYTDIDVFVGAYPEFATLGKLDQYILLSYRNVMVTALRVIPGAGHKNHLLDVVARILEGHQQKYVTGSGENDGTKNRVMIYRRESGVRPTKKMAKGSRDNMRLVDEESDEDLDKSITDKKLFNPAIPKRRRVTGMIMERNISASSNTSSSSSSSNSSSSSSSSILSTLTEEELLVSDVLSSLRGSVFSNAASFSGSHSDQVNDDARRIETLKVDS